MSQQFHVPLALYDLQYRPVVLDELCRLSAEVGTDRAVSSTGNQLLLAPCSMAVTLGMSQPLVSKSRRCGRRPRQAGR